ncbi:effector binding domain-containing protein [Rhodococcus zopfii]|uniref:effector binding domain-containing protein n=1 Tax=Rhodococcus zopfii TaxID=43772 RepID=UPI00093399BF|nr:effector binding domain-containing protein [Rhodococcus zopfii]
MSFQIVQRQRTLVAGLPVRSPRRPLGKLRDRELERAWSAVLKQELGGPLASAYTDHAVEVGSYYTQTVGYQCDSLDQVTPGHIVSWLPAGRYAKFSSTGTFPGILTDLWERIHAAESSGEIVRSFTGDFEFYPHAYGIELYVAVHLPEDIGVQ